MPMFPEWWDWDLSFTSHAMLEKATAFKSNVVEGRFMIHVPHMQRQWIVIVEPDAEAKLLVVVTVYEVSQ